MKNDKENIQIKQKTENKFSKENMHMSLMYVYWCEPSLVESGMSPWTIYYILNASNMKKKKTIYVELKTQKVHPLNAYIVYYANVGKRCTYRND